jgi:twitching motility protein PilT
MKRKVGLLRESVVIALENILEESVKKGAGYVYLKVGIPPMFRVAERLHVSEFDPISKLEIEELVKSLLGEPQLAILEANCQIAIRYSIQSVGAFHVCISMADGTYCLAVRHVPFQIPDVKDLHLPTACEKDLLNRNKGLILVTGPARSGKSTTLAAFIEWINRNRSEHIIAIEKQTEYVHRHRKSIVSHFELGEHESYASAIRRARGQSPDVIQLGSIENAEDVAEAILAAESGTLVFASMITPSSAVQTIDRVLGALSDANKLQFRVRLSNCLLAVLSQILVPRAEIALDQEIQPFLQRQVAACELLINTPAIANLVREEKTAQLYSAIQMGANVGMETLESALAQLVQSGLVNRQDAVSRTLRPDDFSRFFGPRGPDNDPPPGVAALKRPS